MSTQSKWPLCVDLDGTLIASDSLVESILHGIQNRLLGFFPILKSLLRGKAVFKRAISDKVDFPCARQPYNLELIKYIEDEKREGRKIVLATAADRRIADKVSKHVGLFDDVIASDGKVNLSGKNKGRILKEIYGNFTYAGNASVDIDVWKEADEAIVVNAGRSLVKKASKVSKVVGYYPPNKSRTRSVIRMLRVYQWVKNLLIFLPAILSHKVFEVDVFFMNLAAMILFSMCASSVYMLNDIVDLDEDRKHFKKKFRPFASGELSISIGVALIPILLLVSFMSAAYLSFDFFAILLIYYSVTTLYSFKLKKQPIVDVFTLAVLYTSRIFAGAVVTDAIVSPWMIAFSIFIFFSLAMAKRSAELYVLKDDNVTLKRGYIKSDIVTVNTQGMVAGFMAVLIFSLYLSSNSVKALYSHHEYLWSVCFILMFWVSRVWFKTMRGEMDSDPIVFALKDKVSYINGLVVAVIMYLAKG